jgi:hypothetical protein
MQPNSQPCCPTKRKGKNPGKEEIMQADQIAVMIPIVLCVATFSFLSITTWVGGKKKEREAFYKSETLRRITEGAGDGAKQAMEMLREESRLERLKKREGIKLGGLICVAAGAGISVLLGVHHALAATVGLIPGLIGVAMLVYVYKLAAPVE